MLTAKVALHDPLGCRPDRCVHDVEGFVHRTINNAKLVLSVDERDELVCEGLAIMAKLHTQYKPRDAGSRFSGFAAQMLPRKLGDAWHKLHENHQLRTQPPDANGKIKRRYEYRDPAVSLSAMVESEPERITALQTSAEDIELWPMLKKALHERACHEADQAFEYARLIGEGRSDSEAARVLGIRSSDAVACAERIRRVAHKIGIEAQAA